MFTDCNKIRVFFKIIISQSYHTLCKIKVLIWWRIHVWRYFKSIVIDFKFIIDPLSKINLLPFQLVVPREPPLPSQKLFTSLYRMRCQKTESSSKLLMSRATTSTPSGPRSCQWTFFDQIIRDVCFLYIIQYLACDTAPVILDFSFSHRLASRNTAVYSLSDIAPRPFLATALSRLMNIHT